MNVRELQMYKVDTSSTDQGCLSSGNQGLLMYRWNLILIILTMKLMTTKSALNSVNEGSLPLTYLLGCIKNTSRLLYKSKQ